LRLDGKKTASRKGAVFAVIRYTAGKMKGAHAMVSRL